MLPQNPNNLNIYIPRVHEKFSEREIRDEFQYRNIGRIDYMDFSLQPNTDARGPKFYQVFIRMLHWSSSSGAEGEFTHTKQLKLFFEDRSFWILLPNNKPVERSRINTHQLAAYTDKLFVSQSKMEEQLKKQEDEIGALKSQLQQQATDFQAKLDAQMALITKLLSKEAGEVI